MHGCVCLGTLIFEWEGGRADLGRATSMPVPTARALARIAGASGFDGWLVNIESHADAEAEAEAEAEAACGLAAESERSSAPDAGAAAVSNFVSELRLAMNEEFNARGLPLPVVIWYDSMSLSTGRVEWRSALSEDDNASMVFESTNSHSKEHVYRRDTGTFVYAEEKEVSTHHLSDSSEEISTRCTIAPCNSLFLDYHWHENTPRESKVLWDALALAHSRSGGSSYAQGA